MTGGITSYATDQDSRRRSEIKWLLTYAFVFLSSYRDLKPIPRKVITKEDLEKKYATLSNAALLDIVQDKFGYTEVAVLVAMQELSKRDLTEADLSKYKADKQEMVNAFIVNNIVDDLSFLQKNLFFYVWIPFLTFPFKRNFRDDGFELKLKQASYYSWLGFAFCMLLSGLQSRLGFSSILFFLFWMGTFVTAFLFDEAFNRQSQIRKLQRIFKAAPEEEKHQDLE